MTINIATARTAGTLAGKIDAVTGMMSELDAALAGNKTVNDLVIHLSPGDIIIGTLDLQSSKQAFTMLKNLYQSQLNALNAQLAAL